MPLQSIDRY